MRSEVLNLHHR